MLAVAKRKTHRLKTGATLFQQPAKAEDAVEGCFSRYLWRRVDDPTYEDGPVNGIE